MGFFLPARPMTTTTKLTSAAHQREPGHPGRRGRPAKTHDNRTVRQFLAKFWDLHDLVTTFRGANDILTGVQLLRTAGNTSTRGLRLRSLYHVLRHLDDITVVAVQALFRGRYEDQTCQMYAEAARVASKALERFIVTLTAVDLARLRTTKLSGMQAVDAAYAADAAAAEALALAMGPKRRQDTLSSAPDFQSRLRKKWQDF